MKKKKRVLLEIKGKRRRRRRRGRAATIEGARAREKRERDRDRERERERRMTIKFILLVNKQGQTRLAKYTDEFLSVDERTMLEGEIVRKCLSRTEKQCSIIQHRNYKVIYRRYASLFFLVGVDEEENELAIMEFIHCVVETMDRYFGNVCELDIMFHIEKAHFLLDEMLLNGSILDTNRSNIRKSSTLFFSFPPSLSHTQRVSTWGFTFLDFY